MPMPLGAIGAFIFVGRQGAYSLEIYLVVQLELQISGRPSD
jgi:hypothetical protein